MTKKKKKKSIFSACCSCFSRMPIECNELTCPGFVSEVGEFEYIVENMNIKKVPKKILQETPVPSTTNEDFVRYGSQPEPWVGPVVEAEDASFEMSSSENFSEGRKYFKTTHTAGPILMMCENHSPPHKRPGVARTFRAEAKHILDDTIKEFLTPRDTLVQKDEQETKVIADIHENIAEEDSKKNVQVIPQEIKETIDALKVARPLHINSKLFSRNRRSLVQSSSNTSCDKGTFCNLSDEKRIEIEKPERDLNLKTKRQYMSFEKIGASSSISDFPDKLEYNRITSDLQSSETVELKDSIQEQNLLKWKIIINKHKDATC